MKKSILGLALLVCMLFAGINASAAEQATAEQSPINPAGNVISQFTGEYWQKSTPSNKEAFLFGVESAITVEYFVNARKMENATKAGKKPVSTLSPFEKGWMDAFKGITRKEQMDMIDKWYADHPQNLDKPVMAVIWYDLIVPRLKNNQ